MSVFTLVLTLLIVFCLSACDTLTGPNDNESETTTNTSVEPTEPSASPETTVQMPPKNLNPLTGEMNIAPGTWTRPVAVMIGNNDRSRPQCGLDSADILIEGETEGGITRIMALFAGASRIPDKLGPIRSSRPPFILIVKSLNAIYMHAGGDKRVIKMIKDNNLNNINTILGGVHGNTVWRDEGLRTSRGLEYSMLTSGVKTLAAVKSLGYKTTAAAPLFTFGETPVGASSGKELQVMVSRTQTVNFTYNAMSKLYMKGNGTLAKSAAHKTVDGVSLSATNVVVMYDEMYNMTETHIQFRLNAGTGIMLTEGTKHNIKWSRTSDSLSFTDESGSPLVFNRGRTYICLVNRNNQSGTVVK